MALPSIPLYQSLCKETFDIENLEQFRKNGQSSILLKDEVILNLRHSK